MTPDSGSFGAIFDVDGTLIDSHDAHFESWKATLETHEIAYGPEEFRRDFGRRNPEIIGELWSALGREEPTTELMDAVADDKEQRFRAMLVEQSPEMPGACRLMHALHEAGWRIAVGSSAPRENVELAIRILGIEGLLDAVVCGNDVQRGKPEPDVFLRAAELLDLAPANCIVIEDAEPGIDAAHRAGMPAVGIVSKGRTHEELASAERVIDSLKDLDASGLEGIIKEHQG